MYYSIKSGGWQRIAEPTGQEEGLLGIFPYEKNACLWQKMGDFCRNSGGGKAVQLCQI